MAVETHPEESRQKRRRKNLLIRLWNRARQSKTGCFSKATSDMLICHLHQGGMDGLYLKRKNGQAYRPLDWRSVKQDSQGTSLDVGRCGKVIVVLPKSKYLVQRVEIPKVLPKEVSTVLGLEIEANLPSELNPVEISYRSLGTSTEGQSRYEVYYARKDSLVEYLESLETMGNRDCLLVPSAVAWSGILSNDPRLCMIVADLGEGRQFEIALMQEDGSVSVRTIVGNSHKPILSALKEGIAECLRTVRKTASPESDPVQIGWVGNENPPILPPEMPVWQKICPWEKEIPADTEDVLSGSLLLAMAHGLCCAESIDVLETTSLLPQPLVQKKLRRHFHRILLQNMILVLLALGMMQIAIRWETYRCSGAHEDILAKMAAIQTEGEAVGERIEQLRAVTTARMTRYHAYNLLVGLHDATPSGITYSNVELTEEGVVRLRGQADSLSLPFLLPEKLEEQPMFQDAVLKDAGQAKKSGGTVTEFRIECRLEGQKE